MFKFVFFFLKQLFIIKIYNQTYTNIIQYCPICPGDRNCPRPIFFLIYLNNTRSNFILLFNFIQLYFYVCLSIFRINLKCLKTHQLNLLFYNYSFYLTATTTGILYNICYVFCKLFSVIEIIITIYLMFL